MKRRAKKRKTHKCYSDKQFSSLMNAGKRLNLVKMTSNQRKQFGV